MKKYTFLSVCFLFIGILSFAQNKKIDSLKIVLNQTKNDIDKAMVLNAIADQYKTENPKMMLQFANEALQLSKKIDYKLAEGTAYLNNGNANIVLGNYKLAMENFSNAQTVFENELKTNVEDAKALKNGLARAYGSIGVVFSEQSSYANALEYELKALKIYEQTNNLEKCAKLYNNIGIIYKVQDNEFKALEYFTKCLKIQEKNHDETIAITTTNIGTVYYNQKNYPKALAFYNKALTLFEKYPNERGLGELYNNLGAYYKQNNDTAKALENFNNAITTFKQIDDKFGVADTYYYIGELNFEQQKYAEALTNTNKSLALAQELEVTEQVQNAEKLLSEIYEKQNNLSESLKHFKLYSIAKDSVSNAENLRNSVKTEMNFEFDKKEAVQKEEQEKKQLLYQQASKQHKLQLLFAILFALLLAGIAFLIYNRKQLKERLTLENELSEYKQKALHLQMNPHFIFNCLGSISSFILQNGTEQSVKYLAKFAKLMRFTLENSKETLISIDKEIESLQNYLELEQLRHNNVFKFTITKAKDIEDDTALPPLLLQPFVENAIIHGLIPKKNEGTITVDFALNGENLICTVQDNGIGFENSQKIKENLVKVHKSMALDITQKRLEMMEANLNKKAKVDIVELKNQNGEILGTKVVLSLPLQYASPTPPKEGLK